MVDWSCDGTADRERGDPHHLQGGWDSAYRTDNQATGPLARRKCRFLQSLQEDVEAIPRQVLPTTPKRSSASIASTPIRTPTRGASSGIDLATRMRLSCKRVRYTLHWVSESPEGARNCECSWYWSKSKRKIVPMKTVYKGGKMYLILQIILLSRLYKPLLCHILYLVVQSSRCARTCSNMFDHAQMFGHLPKMVFVLLNICIFRCCRENIFDKCQYRNAIWIKTRTKLR